MKPGGLLPHSQVPATCLCLELDRYSPSFPITLLNHSF